MNMTNMNTMGNPMNMNMNHLIGSSQMNSMNNPNSAAFRNIMFSNMYAAQSQQQQQSNNNGNMSGFGGGNPQQRTNQLMMSAMNMNMHPNATMTMMNAAAAAANNHNHPYHNNNPMQLQQMPAAPPAVSLFPGATSTGGSAGNAAMNPLHMFPGGGGAPSNTTTGTTTSVSSPPAKPHGRGKRSSAAASSSSFGPSYGSTPTDSESGRCVPLYVPSDDDSISPYQCLARKHVELFQAQPEDVNAGAQGRNKPITLNQVGIRCIHCKVCSILYSCRYCI